MTAIDDSFASGTERGSAPPRVAEAPPPAARPSLHPDAIKAVMAADHGDPFGILGPHQVGPGAWEVRAVLPEARAATLLTAGRSIPFERRHPDGFFVASVKSEGRPLYEIEIETWDGSRRKRYDPYSFGSSIEQHDVNALREVGTNVVYRVLGAQTAKRNPSMPSSLPACAPSTR